MNPPGYGGPHHLQPMQFVDDNSPSMAHHYQFWQHQGSSQPPFLPLQRQGAEGEEHLVLGTQHELGPNGSHQQFFPVNFKLGLNENSSRKLGAKNEGNGVPDEIMRDFYKKHLHGGKDLDLEDKCRFYGELDDIYGLVKMGELQSNRAGSVSELTGDNSSANAGISAKLADNVPKVVGVDDPGLAGVVHGSNNSVGEEASLARKCEKRKRKRKTLSSMAGFFENLVKRVMDHQDALYRNFLDVLERMDAEREEAAKEWRREEAAKCDNEATAREKAMALATSREAQIVSYIEKLSGQSIGLPRWHDASAKDRSQSRWPKAEVEALIRARSSIESRLQDPGSKGSVWEEVSSLMGSMGYQRSAKRCKEKWENINKYFKKVKESISTKKRHHQSKTCPYFNQLDQLYSRAVANSPLGSTTVSSCSEMCRESQCLPELVANFADVGQHEENAGSVTTSRIEFDGLNDDKFENRDVNHKDRRISNKMEAQEQCGVTAAD